MTTKRSITELQNLSRLLKSGGTLTSTNESNQIFVRIYTETTGY